MFRVGTDVPLGLGFSSLDTYRVSTRFGGIIPQIMMQNQMEKNMEHEMEKGGLSGFLGRGREEGTSGSSVLGIMRHF